MDSSQEDAKQSELSKLKWSSDDHIVTEFLKKFPLPQIVKVVGGFYGDNDESTLSANQVLCLHSVKTIEKVHGRDGSGKEIAIMLECKDRVEVRPTNLKDVYESVNELCSVFPRHVRVSQGYYDLARDEELLSVGDKLYLKSIDESKTGEKKLICVNQNRQTIELPQDCVAGFQPLADGKEYYLSEIVSQFQMPVNVQFVEPYSIGKQTRSEDKFLSQPLPIGTLCLDGTDKETLIIATSIREGKRTVVNFSPDAEISLGVCEDMLQNSPEYVNLCKSFNQAVDFENINADNVYEYIDEDVNTEEPVLNTTTTPSGSKKPKPKKVPRSKNQPKAKPVPKPRTKTSNSNAKIGEKVTDFIRRHSFSATAKQEQSDKANQEIYTEPNALCEDIEQNNNTEAKSVKDSLYTELDPTYISTQKYEKPLKQAEHVNPPNPATPGVSGSKPQKASRPEKSSTYTNENGNPSLYTELVPTCITTDNHTYDKPLKQAQHLDQSSPATPGVSGTKPQKASRPEKSNTYTNENGNPSRYTELVPTCIATDNHTYDKPLKQAQHLNQSSPATPGVLGTKPSTIQPRSNSYSDGIRNPPVVPDRPDLKPTRFSMPNSPQLPDNLIALLKNPPQLLNRPPLVPAKPKVSDNPPETPIVPDRKPTAANQPQPVPNKPRPKSITASPDIPNQLLNKPPLVPAKPKVSDNTPERPIVPDRKPTAPDQPRPIHNKPRPNSITASPDSPNQLPTEPQVLDNPPGKPILSERKPAAPNQLLPEPNKPSEGITATPDSQMPEILNGPPDRLPTVTPEQQKEEIYQALAKYPSDLTSLSIAEVSRLLKCLGMASYVEQFQSELIDGEMLVTMDAEGLESLDISSFYVKKLLKFIGGWRPNQNVPP